MVKLVSVCALYTCARVWVCVRVFCSVCYLFQPLSSLTDDCSPSHSLFQFSNECGDMITDPLCSLQRFFTYLRLFLEAFRHLPGQQRTLWRGVSVDLSEQVYVGCFFGLVFWFLFVCFCFTKYIRAFHMHVM